MKRSSILPTGQLQTNKTNNTMEKFLSEFIPANQEIDVERYERLGYTVTKNSKVWRLRKLTNLKEHERLGSEYKPLK